MRHYHAYEIKWDTDGENVPLPNEVRFDSEVALDDEGVSDYLSDSYGFCVLGFCFAEESDPKKPVHTAELAIDKAELDKWEAMVESEDVDYDAEQIPRLSTVKSWTVRFDDGCFADLKVNSNEREDRDLWTEAVLFGPDGSQVDYTEVSYGLRGNWRLSSKDADYDIKVVEKK